MTFFCTIYLMHLTEAGALVGAQQGDGGGAAGSAVDLRVKLGEPLTK